MRKAFLEFLAAEGAISAGQRGTLEKCGRGAAEPIGSIAFRYGMIRCEDIDEILDEQGRSGELFGEIAIRRGVLTRKQVDALLQVQQLRAASEVAEALALSGMCPASAAIEKLGRFLVQSTRSAVCAQA